MIALSGVEVESGPFRLSGISFEVAAGEYAILMGRTGTGKSTLLEAVCGLRRVTKGTIRLGDRDVTSLDPAERNVGYVPQDLALFPTMTVRRHLEFAPRIRRFPRSRVVAKVEELSELLGIGPLLDRRVHRLSGGERQRVALGRALAFEPSVLLLDEPLSALDESTRNAMQRLLQRVRERTGVTTLHVTHSQAEADALGTTVLRLEEGAVHVVKGGAADAASE